MAVEEGGKASRGSTREDEGNIQRYLPPLRCALERVMKGEGPCLGVELWGILSGHRG